MDLTIEGKAYVNGSFEDCCIGVSKGKIVAVKKILKADEHFDFGKKLVLPAGIDVHVHFRDPGMTHKEDFGTGSMAAAFGGVSCVFDMPNTIPETADLPNLSDKISSTNKKSYVDFGIYVGVTDYNVGKIGVLGKKCSGFKIYLGTTTNALHFDASNLDEVLEKIGPTGKPVLFHAEDYKCLKMHERECNTLVDYLYSRPSECEENAIKNIVNSSKNCNVRIHVCHLSSCESLELLRRRPNNISCGATPHHLLFSIENNLVPEPYYKVNPPIRTSFDRDALFDGIKNGFIDILESDHAPHTLDEKDKEFNAAPSGLPGVETMLPIFLYKAKKDMLSFQRLISAVCERPAELVGISKGRIEVGRDADFIVVDLKEESEIKSDRLHSKCGWSPYGGERAIFPQHVFVRGEKIIDNHEIQVNKGFGRFVGA